MISVVENGEVYEVSFRYDPALVAKIKNVPGKRWNPQAKMWTIPKEHLGWWLNELKDTPYESSEGFVTVCKDGKYGILKSDGTEVVPCRFNSLTTVHNGRAFASENGTDWGILCVDKKISEGIAPSRSTEKTTADTSRKSTSKYSASSSVSSRSSQKSKSSSSKSSVSTSSGSKNQKTSNSSKNTSSNKSTTSRKVNG